MSRPLLTSLASTTLYADDTLAVGELGAVCVAIWRGAVTESTFQKQRETLAAVIGRHPDGAGFLCVIEPTAKPPSDAIRRKSIEMLASHKGQLAFNAVVIEGQGFQAAIARGVFSGMRLVYRHDTPAKVFPKVADAATWMGTLLQPLPSDRMMVAGVDEIRSRIGVSRLGR